MPASPTAATLLLGAAFCAGLGAQTEPKTAPTRASGGEELSERQVSALPLNKRDFSQLLLLATGTQTDTNGAANFTQQFTVNGQRGSATVFHMDGTDTTDPEMGGATFSNFNVDAIQEIRSSSGVLPAEIGHGAAGYTEILTKTGVNDLHGSLFEFLRNAALDARNFFDRRSVAQPGRIPPFVRNEFGFTLGGPLVIPGLIQGRNRTYFFGQYQGFRQVLGTTQILSVPTLEERRGVDTTAFPGDTLYVPIHPEIASVLARYPLPNDLHGPFGARTYATSSKVHTVTDQFSVRLDHELSAKSKLFGRVNLNNVTGPLTNPNQTAIDPSFAILFNDHQRSAGIAWIRTPSPTFVSESYLGYIRATPLFPTDNRTQPALLFGDGLYEAFNSPSGSILGAYGNLYQLRQNFSWTRPRHTWKAGGEVRVNRDTTVYGVAPNGTYSFGGGAAYSTVAIRSMSGAHNIAPGDPLPDTLTGFLTATPFSYTVTAAPPIFPQGENMGAAAVRRQAYNLFVQDRWSISSNLALSYGLRYEVNSTIREAKKQEAGLILENDAGAHVNAMTEGAHPHYLIRPEPYYPVGWSGWGPRLSLDWSVDGNTVLRAGGSITSLLMNLWQQNMVTANLPIVVTPTATAEQGRPLPFKNAAVAVPLPEAYSTSGQRIFDSQGFLNVAPNTEMDVLRYERDLAAVSPDGQVRALGVQSMNPDLKNGYVATWTLGVERRFRDVTASAAYVATSGVGLGFIETPNGYPGAEKGFAPLTRFDQQGRVQGGFGAVWAMSSHAHSTYHSLQTSVGKTSLRGGLGFNASYTYSKSIDDTSAVLGGFIGIASGTQLQTSPQNPRDRRGEKGPSTFDITHAFTFSAIEELAVERLLPKLNRRASRGWQFLAVGTLLSGAPFTVYSGIQQTGYGSNNADRPDAVGQPDLSTSRAVREDYFGGGGNNKSFFSLPIHVAGGSGPNQGRFGALGRNTHRGPAFHNFDFSLIKNTPVGPPSNPERIMLQARFEVFNAFNIVNFGLPANIVQGPGFGVINRTAGPSRQIQVSLKLIF
ncbi:MAG: TonB-dependent receptor [Acidobacteria bacterium]|nr:TonB-dependent receptor [Acidobacteriota bacterium]